MTQAKPSGFVTQITKGEAADRQLRQAIRLFFAQGDMLAIHTLAGAAFQLLADLGAKRGIRSRLRESDRIVPDRKKEWHAALVATQNFLKHADRDPQAKHEYNEKGTIFLLFETVNIAAKVIKFACREKVAFELWFLFSFPHLILQPYRDETTKLAEQFGVNTTDRALWHHWLNEP